ncbi:YSC84-related protein [Stenotrophomonas sp. SY1]|uniref:lipid-binding SYLF domain-containing protein n=1 Tax=Stenotrophomonas sp. SY1 TaxID=477235 RepID=UPI001E3C7458|nr:YSC84-related protein [Stenotrophomonas sp. SY1]MCD9085339.1 hypothetical protein [Stenotrophomonas sp. SY1]
MKSLTLPAVAIALLAGLLGGCSSSGQSSPGTPAAASEKHEAQRKAREEAALVLSRLYAQQPDARHAVEHAAGYAVFRSVGLKVLIAGGGSGHGVAIDNRSGQETFMRMVEVQAGLGFGAKQFDLVWIFRTPEAYNDFITQGIQIGGQATLAAKVDGAGAGVAGAAQVSDAVWVYQMTGTGLAAELTVKGTRYYPDKKLN